MSAGDMPTAEELERTLAEATRVWRDDESSVAWQRAMEGWPDALMRLHRAGRIVHTDSQEFRGLVALARYAVEDVFGSAAEAHYAEVELTDAEHQPASHVAAAIAFLERSPDHE